MFRGVYRLLPVLISNLILGGCQAEQLRNGSDIADGDGSNWRHSGKRNGAGAVGQFVFLAYSVRRDRYHCLPGICDRRRA
jgi:hypothetical protein